MSDEEGARRSAWAPRARPPATGVSQHLPSALPLKPSLPCEAMLFCPRGKVIKTQLSLPSRASEREPEALPGRDGRRWNGSLRLPGGGELGRPWLTPPLPVSWL